MADRIEKLIQSMTLEEKARMCVGDSTWTTLPVERLGIPHFVMADGPHGVRRVEDVHAVVQKSLPATCFPTASCLASTWDRELIHELGEAIADECIALDVDVVLGPGVNMKRSPLCGRNFEYFSEDPFLAGEMAVSMIRGIQGKGVGTSLKHFTANNQEFQRFTMSSEVDERTLREIYLPAFEKAVKKAEPWTVMCSYNRVNGTLASQNRYLLTDILREEWGFEGMVVSDWGAVRDRVAGLQAGLDLEMPGPHDRNVKRVVDAVQAGELDQEALDKSVRRILEIVFRAKQTAKNGSYDIDAHHALARRIAARGMVLLKNEGILPLRSPEKIAVIGAAARTPHFQGGGSSHINPTRVDVPLDELKALAGDAHVTFAQGYPPDDGVREDLIEDAVQKAKEAEVAVLFIALPSYKESEGYDRSDLDLTDQQERLIQAVSATQPNTVVVLNNGAPVAVGEWIDGAAAVLEAWMMGQAGGGAVADVLFGRINPGGRLAETFPVRLEDTPAYLNFPGERGRVRYGEGLYIGYRWYDARRIPVRFPFGYGLSYTTFEYSGAAVSAKTFRDTDGVVVTVDVTNTGGTAGSEVVQVYVSDREAGLSRPVKELKGFARVDLQPGETRTVSISLDFRAFAFYHPSYKQWITEDGEFDILVGASAADIRDTFTVTLESSMELPCLLNRESTLREWKEDPRGSRVFGLFYDRVSGEMLAELSSGEGESETLGLDFMDMMQDVPLTSVLQIIKGMLPAPPEELVDMMLNEVHSGSE